MPRRPYPASIYPIPRTLRAGPWVGMHDALEPGAARSGLAKLLRNCYATATEGGIRCVQGVPGFEQAGTQLGSMGARVVQWIGALRLTNGTVKNLVFCNGVLSEYDFGTDAFTTRLTNAEIAAGTGTPTLSTTARVYGLTYADQLIVSDGINVPFQWDGTSGGGVVELSNCPVIYGQPRVYNEKMVIIKAAERDTWAWSEEGDPTLGYDTSPYENAWNFGGPNAERLVAFAARSGALGILRERSTTEVYGAIASEFRTTANESSVSETLGTTAPASVLVLDEGTMTVDASGRPQFWPRGRGYTAAPALWDGCEQTVRDVVRSQIANTQVFFDEPSNLIRIAIARDGAAQLSTVLLFERTGDVPNFVGYMDGFPSTRWGVWVDGEGRERIVHAGADDGYLYLHGTPEEGPWNYGLNAGPAAIEHEIKPSFLGADIHDEKNFDEFGVEVMLNTTLDLTLGYDTPTGTSSTTQIVTLALSGARYGTAIYGTDRYGGGDANTRTRVGIDEHGRWLLPSIRHAAVNQQFSIIACDALAFVEGRDPEVA